MKDPIAKQTYLIFFDGYNNIVSLNKFYVVYVRTSWKLCVFVCSFYWCHYQVNYMAEILVKRHANLMYTSAIFGCSIHFCSISLAINEDISLL